MKLDPTDLRQGVLNILAPNLKRIKMKPGQLQDDDNFLEKGILDSVGFLEFINQLEQKMNLSIDFSELDPAEFSTLSGLITQLTE